MLQKATIAKCQSCTIEAVERVEDQQGYRLAEIEGGLPFGTKQIASVELGNAGTDVIEIGGSHNGRRFRDLPETLEIKTQIDACGYRRADQECVACFWRPAWEIRCAEVGRIELRTSRLGHTVDATRCRLGDAPARQGLPG
jgi:hypothetical protein